MISGAMQVVVLREEQAMPFPQLSSTTLVVALLILALLPAAAMLGSRRQNAK